MSRHSKKQQRGAIGLFGVLTLMMAVLFVAVAVDSGRMWMIKRQLQNVADMAAIAAGGQAGGCGQGGGSNIQQQLIVAAAQGAAMANGFQGDLAAAPNAVQLGTYATDEGGVRTFMASNTERRAVRVLATREVPSSLFAGGIFNQRVLLQAEATAAIRTPFAAFRVGSTVADVNLLNNLLSGILGSNVRLLSYEGLLKTNVNLLNLVNVVPNIGSVSELLNMDISLRQLFSLLQATVDQSGNASAQGLGGVVENLGYLATGTVRSLDLRLADVIQVSNPDMSSVASTQLNLLNLITTAAFVANGSNFINLPLGVSLPGLTEIKTSVQIVELPKLVIGPPAGGVNRQACTSVKTAQVRTESIVKVNALAAAVDLRLRLEVGAGKAELMDINIPGTGNTIVAVNAYPGLATLKLTNSSNDNPARVSLLLGLLPLADISLNAPIAQPAPSTMRFTIDHPVNQSLPMTMNSYSGVGNSLAGFAAEGNLVVKVLGLDLGGILNPVIKTLVLPVLVAITSSILDPLLKLLGINISGVTVILDEVNSGSSQALLR